MALDAVGDNLCDFHAVGAGPGSLTGRTASPFLPRGREVPGATLGAAFSNGRMQINNGIPETGERFTLCEMHLMRFEDGKLVADLVGGLKMFEMWQAPVFAPKPLGGTS